MTDKPSFTDRMKAKLRGGNRVWAMPRSSPSLKSAPPYHGVEGNWSISLPSQLLAEGERGLVLTDFRVEDFTGGGMCVSSPTSTVEGLHTELIFYDRIDVPEQFSLMLPSSTFQVLDRLGIAQRTKLGADGDVSAVVRRHAIEAYLALDTREAGRWAMGRSVRSLGVTPRDLSPRQGVQLYVSEVLPVFAANVDLDAVLAFKRRRWSELLTLRTAVDDLALEIGTNGTSAVLETTAFKNFQAALVNHMKVMDESNYEKVKRSFSASFSWESLASPGLELLATGTVTLNSALGVGLTIGAKTIDGLRSKKGSSPFEYLTSANRDLG